MNTSVPIGVGLPQVFPSGKTCDLAGILTFAKKAEHLGFESLWTLEQIADQGSMLEPISLLSYVSAVTKQIRLGTSVFVLPQRNPIQLAKSLSTLDLLNNGRTIAGIGIGNGDDLNSAFGLAPGKRVRRFKENLAVMRALWADGNASFDGDFYKFENLRMSPKPQQRPGIPVWFGARSVPALKRAAKLADGWMGAGSSSIIEFKEHIGILKRALEDFDRDVEKFTFSKRIYLAVDTNLNRAENRMKKFFEHTYGNPDMASHVAIWGSQESVFERINEIIDLGANHVLAHFVFDFDEHLEALAPLVNKQTN